MIKYKLLTILNGILMYFGKIVHPSVFSFVSIPKFIILPAFLMSIKLFAKWKREKETNKLLLPLIFWTYLFVYIIRWSYGRYLIPIAPLIMLFFVFFIKDGMKDKRFARNTIIASMIYVCFGLYFEISFIFIKIILYLIIFSGFWGIYYYQNKKVTEEKKINRYKFALIGMIGFFTFSVFAAYSLVLNTQVSRYFVWGYNSQCKEIATHFKEGEKVWINYNYHLIAFFRKEMYCSYINKESKDAKYFELQDWVPKKYLMKKRVQYTYDFQYKNSKQFKDKLNQRGIDTVALLVSTSKDKKFVFPQQGILPKLEKMEMLKLKKKIPMKNKILYIFSVKK